MAPQQQPEEPAGPGVLGDGALTHAVTGQSGAGQVIAGEVLAALPAYTAQPAGDGEDTGTGEIRAAERSAERAAAVAATEGFHPLRVRPYVAEPDGSPGETTVRPLLAMDPDKDGPATADLGLFPALYSGLEYAQAEPVPAYAESAAGHGRHRRRKRGVVVAAAAVAASALAAGAVAVSGQVTGHEQGGTDLAQPDRGTAMPDVTLPTDAALATATMAPPMTHRAAPTTTATSAGPTATPSGSPRASTPVTVPPPRSAPATTTPPASPPTTAPAQSTPSRPPAAPATASLQIGDSGPAVVDLQQRLSHVLWYYDEPANGVFDREVQAAVATFQVWYGVQGDPTGVYGPHTRQALERQGSWH